MTDSKKNELTEEQLNQISGGDDDGGDWGSVDNGNYGDDGGAVVAGEITPEPWPDA